jgi:hypothetical protein
VGLWDGLSNAPMPRGIRNAGKPKEKIRKNRKTEKPEKR